MKHNDFRDEQRSKELKLVSYSTRTIGFVPTDCMMCMVIHVIHVLLRHNMSSTIEHIGCDTTVRDRIIAP